MPSQMANLTFNMYAGDRRIALRGNISEVLRGMCGLIAGCGLAVRMLKAHFLDLEANMLYSVIRIYVDDVTLTATGRDPRQAIRRVGHDLPKCQAGMQSKNQVSNAAKEQFYSPSAAALKL